MTRLAELMCLGISSLTRVVDQLETKRYVTRRRLPADLRVCFVEMTATEREGLLTGLRKLNAAIDCCGTLWNTERSGE